LVDKTQEEKALELQEREAILITRERTLERTIREVLRREQVVTRKEERIDAFMRQLQNMGLGELADSIEQAFKLVLADLREELPEARPQPTAADKMHDGGSFEMAARPAAPAPAPAPRRGHSPLDGLDEVDKLDAPTRAKRYLERLDRELGGRERGEAYDRADRMRYLARTFEENGNHEKASEFARRALTVLDHFQ
jgi:hypothetical protein